MKKNKIQIIDIIFMLFLSLAYLIPLFMSKGTIIVSIRIITFSSRTRKTMHGVPQ